MRSFFLKLALVSIVAVAAIVAYWWSVEEEISGVHRVNSHLERGLKIAILTRDVPRPLVVFAGDSRAEKSLLPSMFAEKGLPAINIATASGDLPGLVSAMEASGLDKLKAIFLISASIFNVNDGAQGEGHLSPEEFFAFTPWERIRVFKMSYFLEAHRNLKKARDAEAFPAYWSQMAARGAQIPNGGFVIDGGSDQNKPSCERVHFGSRHSKNFWYRNVRIDGAKWRVFKEAMTKLSGWAGTYIVYSPPIAPVFRTCIEGTYVDEAEKGFAEEALAHAASLRAEGKRNVQFVDFYDQPPSGFTDDDFFDTHHLNSRGARKFTSLWYETLIRSGLVGSR